MVNKQRIYAPVWQKVLARATEVDEFNITDDFKKVAKTYAGVQMVIKHLVDKGFLNEVGQEGIRKKTYKLTEKGVEVATACKIIISHEEKRVEDETSKIETQVQPVQ